MCWFQVCSKVIQLHNYIYLFFFQFFYFGYIILSRVPCASQWVLIITFKYLEIFCSRLFKKYLFIYFWLAGSLLLFGLFSSCGEQGNALAVVMGFSFWRLPLLQSRGSRAHGLRSCGSRAQEQWCTCFVAPLHVGSSRIRDQTRVSCIGRQTLYH